MWPPREACVGERGRGEKEVAQLQIVSRSEGADS